MNKKFILQQLLLLQDASYKEFQKKLIPGTDNIIGIRMPILRKFAKNLRSNNWQEYLDEALPIPDTYHEETMLQGLIIAEAKINYEDRLKSIGKYLPKRSAVPLKKLKNIPINIGILLLQPAVPLNHIRFVSVSSCCLHTILMMIMRLKH